MFLRSSRAGAAAAGSARAAATRSSAASATARSTTCATSRNSSHTLSLASSFSRRRPLLVSQAVSPASSPLLGSSWEHLHILHTQGSGQVRWLRKPPINVPPAYRPYDSDDEDDGGGGTGGGSSADRTGRRHSRAHHAYQERKGRRNSRRGRSGERRQSADSKKHHQQQHSAYQAYRHRRRVARSAAASHGGHAHKGATADGIKSGASPYRGRRARNRRFGGSMRDIDELLAMEADVSTVMDRYEDELRGSYDNSDDGDNDDGVVFHDLDTVQRKRKEDAERRRGSSGSAGDIAGNNTGNGASEDNHGVDNTAEAERPPPAATISAIQSTESSYKKAATLLRKLVSGWSAVRQYSHGDQLEARSMLPTGNVMSGRPTGSPPQRVLAFLNQLEDMRIDRERAVRGAIDRERREQAEAAAVEKARAESGSIFGTVGRMFGFGHEKSDGRGGSDDDDTPTTAFALAPNDSGEYILDGVTAHNSPEYVAERHLYRQAMKSSIHWYRAAAASSADELADDDGDELDVAEGKGGGSDSGSATRVATSEQDLGRHLSSILNEMTKRARKGNSHVWPNEELYLIVIKVFSQVGTLTAANTAHRLLGKLEKSIQEAQASCNSISGGEETRISSRPRLHAYHLVLQAYRNVKWTRKKHVRTAVAKAEKLILNDLQNVDSQVLVPNVVSYNLLLDTLSRAGHGVIPNLCGRVDAVVEKMVGSREDFLHLVGEADGANTTGLAHLSGSETAAKSPAQHVAPDMFTKHLLLGIYAGKSGDRRYTERAKHLLASMEESRERQIASNAGENTTTQSRRRGTSDRRWSEDDFFMTLPNRETYNAVLRSLLQTNDAVQTNSVPSNVYSTTNTTTFEEDAMYATGLLDSMIRHEGSQPSKFTYNYVLRLWAKSGAREAGIHAEDILSRMEVRAAICAGTKGGGGGAARLSAAEIPRPDALCYQNAVACWGVSAAKSFPGAASRAMMLLNKMEAQCSPGYETFGNDDVRNYLLDHIYNESVRPNRFVFTTLIMSCACTQLEADKSDALRIAFDAYNRMIDAGLAPSSETYANLLKICKNLLPEESQLDQRNQLSQTVFEAARDHGQVNAHLLMCLRNVNPVLYKSYQN